MYNIFGLERIMHMLVLEQIHKIEIVNSEIDWLGFFITFISVFFGAFLAYYFSNKIENKKYEQRKKEMFINELIDQCNNIYYKYIEILHLISQISLLYDDDNFKEKLMVIIEQIRYCLKGLKALITLIEIPLEKILVSRSNDNMNDYVIVACKVNEFLGFMTQFLKKNVDILFILDEMIQENSIDVQKIKNKVMEINNNKGDKIFFECIKELKKNKF